MGFETERVFTVEGAVATRANPVTLAEAGLKERADLQEWVLRHPDILGPDVLVVTFGFDRWRSAAGERAADRLDVLGLGSDGRLVVAELKRDAAPDTVEMQAVKYAAMASRFTEDLLVHRYVDFLRRTRTEEVDEASARGRLYEHADLIDPAQLRRPRIVLVAGSFPAVVTASVVWLTEMGLDITLQRVQAYRVFDGRTLVTVSQVFPIPDVEEFTIAPFRGGATSPTDGAPRRREQSGVVQLVSTKAIPDGTRLHLRPFNDVGPEVRTKVEEWIKAQPNRGVAIWHNDRAKPLEWLADGALPTHGDRPAGAGRGGWSQPQRTRSALVGARGRP